MHSCTHSRTYNLNSHVHALVASYLYCADRSSNIGGVWCDIDGCVDGRLALASGVAFVTRPLLSLHTHKHKRERDHHGNMCERFCLAFWLSVFFRHCLWWVAALTLAAMVLARACSLTFLSTLTFQ